MRFTTGILLALLYSHISASAQLRLELVPLENTQRDINNIFMPSDGNLLSAMSGSVEILMTNGAMPLGALLVSNESDVEATIPIWFSGSWKVLITTEGRPPVEYPLLSGYRNLPNMKPSSQAIAPNQTLCIALVVHGIWPDNFHADSMVKAKAHVELQSGEGDVLLSNEITVYQLAQAGKQAEQSGPAYPPQGVGSADP